MRESEVMLGLLIISLICYKRAAVMRITRVGLAV